MSGPLTTGKSKFSVWFVTNRPEKLSRFFPVVKGPRHREHPVFCDTNHTVQTPPPCRRRYAFRRGSIPFSRRILLIPTLAPGSNLVYGMLLIRSPPQRTHPSWRRKIRTLGSTAGPTNNLWLSSTENVGYALLLRVLR